MRALAGREFRTEQLATLCVEVLTHRREFGIVGNLQYDAGTNDRERLLRVVRIHEADAAVARGIDCALQRTSLSSDSIAVSAASQSISISGLVVIASRPTTRKG